VSQPGLAHSGPGKGACGHIALLRPQQRIKQRVSAGLEKNQQVFLLLRGSILCLN
jgi:hypothetical protein